jgi:hypothetical protein
LIAIGCNSFDDPSWGQLEGAENDARSMFEKLVQEGLGEFSSEHSKLLLSPSLSEVRTVISETLFGIENIECFTLFYAGHGEVKDGTYFLTCRDSYLARLSLTGLSTSVLFSYINEVKCAHTNIIIDACFSAGLVHDIGSLLKPEIIGRRNAFSLSILAAASSDEPASEENGRGYCTQAILDCLSGNTAVPTKRATLDLLDVGNAVASQLPNHRSQNPEYWGISLKGHVPFCRNPLSSLETSFKTELPSDFNPFSQNQADAIWAEYFKLDDDFESEALLELIREATDKLSEYPEQAAYLALNVATSFCQKIANSHSGFQEAEINGAALTAILRFAESDSGTRTIVIDLYNRICAAVKKGISALNSAGENDKYFLLSGGVAELYYLPLRISKILGWIGAGIHIADALNIEIDKTEVQEFCSKIIESYSTSIFSVSDTQAPYIAAFVSAAFLIGLDEEAEMITALMFNSFVRVGGRITSTSVPCDQIIRYLISTGSPEEQDLNEGVLAKPSELLGLFFVLYRKLDMRDELDSCLADLDHRHLVLYIPEEYGRFSDSIMRGGQNHTFQIGHGVWRLSDFEKSWPSIQDEIAKCLSATGVGARLGAIISSLLQPDRTAWFLLTDEGSSNPKPE